MRALCSVSPTHTLCTPPGSLASVHAVGLLGEKARSEALRLVAEHLHHLRAHHTVGEAGVVLHVGRLLQQPAPCEALDHERAEVGTRCIQRGRIPGRAAPDHDHILDVAHLISNSRARKSRFTL